MGEGVSRDKGSCDGAYLVYLLNGREGVSRYQVNLQFCKVSLSTEWAREFLEIKDPATGHTPNVFRAAL